MGDTLILLGGIISAVILFQIFAGIIAGNIFDNYKKNIHHTHYAFMLYGILSFFGKIRHKYICDKCFKIKRRKRMENNSEKILKELERKINLLNEEDLEYVMNFFEKFIDLEDYLHETLPKEEADKKAEEFLDGVIKQISQYIEIREGFLKNKPVLPENVNN